MGDAALVFYIVSDVSHRVKRVPNHILILEVHEFEMPLKKTVRSIHKMIAVLRQAASTKVSPKATDQTSSIEVTSYFNGASDNFNHSRIVLEHIVVHRKR